MDSQKQTYPPRKGIAHYFWGFFSLLLAVVLGFFIENQRKIYVEGKNEKRLVASIIQDLRSEVSEMERNIRLRSARYGQLDSIIIILGEKMIFGHETDLYFLGKMATREVAFYANEKWSRDMDRVGYSGSTNYQNVIDTLQSYSRAINVFLLEQGREADQVKPLLPLMAKIFDPYIFEQMETADGGIIRPDKNLFLKNADPELLGELAFYLQDYKSGIRYRMGQLRKLQVKAKRIIAFLESEYKL